MLVQDKRQKKVNKPGHIMLFGSGEMSPTGRKIHEDVLKESGIISPVKVGILETPTGFEVNAIHAWPERMEAFFEKGLKNFKPQITRIRAWRKKGEHSTDDPHIVDAISLQQYLYSGAGSPSYATEHLKNSRAWTKLIEAHKNGTTLCLGSATAVAVGRFALPVYEIFKAGHDLFWLDGLDLFSLYGLSLTVIPHWNNQEGEDFDTTRCWMGKERFAKLLALLPPETVILGIDEQTAAVFDFAKKEVEVMGVGGVTILKNNVEKVIASGAYFLLSELLK